MPATTWTGPDGGGFGEGIAGAGDVDRDGHADFVVGAPMAPESGLPGPGRVYLFSGSATGPASTASTTLTGPDSKDGSFGQSVY